MTITADLIMFLWGPIVVLLFAVLRPRRAVIVGFLAAWLFLPMTSYEIPGLPDYTKAAATSVCVLIGAMLFDMQRLLQFRFRWFDIPMAIWCAVPFAASIANSHGFYDGASGVLIQLFTWGIPYFLGRTYFTDFESLQELAIGIFIGGLVYMPLCWFEIRMSPQLHRMFYGEYQHAFEQTKRFAGWRPMVFMRHGLMVSSWMAAASLLGFWMWYTGAVRRIRGVSIGWPLTLLVLTTILCKSIGAILLMVAGMLLLVSTHALRSAILVGLLFLIPPTYIAVRTTQSWDGTQAVKAVQSVSEERAYSLGTRFHNEDMLIARAFEKPVMGWGRWGDHRVLDDVGKDISITDGFWIITFGRYGLVGLISAFTAIMFMSVRIWQHCRGATWTQPHLAPAVAMAVVLLMFSIDCLPNSMVNPIFLLCAGAIAFVPGARFRVAAVPVRNQGNTATDVRLVPRKLWPLHPHAP